jgi:Putative methyltransferase
VTLDHQARYPEIVTSDGHWIDWHTAYEDPRSSLSRRLVAVQRRLSRALDEMPSGPIRLVSMCAGQGRDVIGVLADHRRSHDVNARLVEINSQLVNDARTMAERAGLSNLEINVGDASTTLAYVGAVPADILLVCGVFGNISDTDIHGTVTHLPHLLAPGATVIWTRHRLDPDLTPTIRGWFRDSGFEDVAFDAEEGTHFGVGTHRLVSDSQPYELDTRMFTFLGDGAEAHF